MKHLKFLLVGLLMLGAAFPLASAAVQIQQQLACPYGEVVSIQNAGLIALLNAGQTVICTTVPHHVARIGDTATLTVQAFGPTLIALPNSGAGAIIASPLTGCTFQGVSEAVFQTNSRTIGSASGQETQASTIGGDVVANQWGTFTMTGTTCSGFVRAYACIATTAISTCGGGSNLYNLVFAINIETGDTRSQVMTNECGATLAAETSLTTASTCTNPQVDTENRLCAASTFGAACATPTINDAITGTLTVTNAGGQTMTVSGTLDVLDRLCAASPTGSSCTVATVNGGSGCGATTAAPCYYDNLDRLCNASAFSAACTAPTVNVANTGTQHLIIDSWPSLTAALSGTVNVVNSGSQSITVSGTLDNLNRFCASSATGSSCTTPTVNLGGAITVHNDGTLSVTNSGGQTMTVAGTLALSQSGTWTVTNAGGQSITFAGPLTVHQDPICTASAHCHIDSNSTSVIIGNSSQTVAFPSNLTVQASFPTTAASLGIDAWIGTLFWVALLAFFLWQDWPFPAAFALMGLLNAIIPSLPGNFQGYFLFVILGVVMQYFAGDRMTTLSPFNRRRTVKS